MRTSHCKRRVQSVFKELCVERWRAAFLPRRVQRDVDEDAAHWFDRREACKRGMKNCRGLQFGVVVPDCSDHPRIKRALRWSCDGWLLIVKRADLLHLQMAMMRAIATAAGWKSRIRIRREREQRRNQRDAEEQQQRDGQKASHTAIVADCGREVIEEVRTADSADMRP